MQGYIYVENKESTQLKYQPRYFILFPFCGLRWFMEEPEDSVVTKLLMSASEGGWVFGGNIRVSNVSAEPPAKHNLTVDTPIYPFVLDLSGPDKVYTIRLGCDDDDIRQNWIDEILKAMHIQHYIFSCVECGAVPSKSIFCAALAGQSSIILENINMTVPTLGSLVMVCKLNQSHGTFLQALHLENAQLGDLHMPLLCSLLTFSPTIQSLSLANNYITCEGIKELSELLIACVRLILLDLSSNFVGDNGAEALSGALAKTTKLKHLDLSRNRVTPDGAKLLAFGIAGFDSAISSLNLSFNRLGDSAASLAALLMTNEPAKIENIDLSYCGIQTAGLKELARALVGCISLHNLVLTGNQGDDNAVALLMDALTLHQRKFGIGPPLDPAGAAIARKNDLLNPDKSALTLHLGGLVLEDMPVTLHHKTMRHAMAYACQQSSIPRITLFRRIAPADSLGRANAPLPSSLKSQAATTDLYKTLTNVSSWICVRVQLMQHMECVYDVLDSFARLFGADPRQLQMLSCTDMDEIDSCFIILTPTDPDDESIQKAVTQHTRITQRYNLRIKTRGAGGGYVSSLHKSGVDSAMSSPEPPSADGIIEMLRELARNSSPSLRKIGVRTVFIQMNPNKEGMINKKGPSTFHCHIKGGGSGGDGILSEYIPPLFPMASVLDNINEAADEEDVDVEPIFSPSSTGIVGQAISSLSLPARDDGHRDSVWYHEDDDEDEEAEGTGGGGGEWKDNIIDDHGEFAVGGALVFDSAVQEVTENIDSKIILAIRKLQQSGEIPMDAGAFWQQAFAGGGDTLVEVKEDALDDDGLFHNVGARKRICDAMLQRNTHDLSMSMNFIKANNIMGGLAVRLGEQLLSEVSALHRDAGNLESLAQKPEDINIVETFLMTCGRMGYSGKETMTAIEFREYLVRWALQDDPEYYKELDGIKQRSRVTNIMISRDFELLRSTLDAQDSKLLPREQKQIAMQLLDDCDAAKANLMKALDEGSMERLEDCIAEAAYLNIYDDDVDRAVEVMLEMGGDVDRVFTPLLQSLRAGSKSDLDTTLTECKRLGWDHPFIHESSLKIYDERNRVVQEDIAKHKTLAMSSDIKNGYEVKTIEVMQLLRVITSLGLNQNPALQPHIQLLDKYVKRMAGLASQEEEILKLIDEKNLEKLSEVLSGRGTGRLVMSAPSAEAMKEWIDILQLGCNMGIDAHGNEVEVYKSGTLEKAARGKEGGLRNWRQRFFVLDKLSISYYTRAGGEKKGNVRVGGGAVRILTAEDTGGRQFCFELQEGRDLSIIDPDLLFEARRQVNIMHRDNLEEVLAIAVAEQSEQNCSTILDRANELQVDLDSDLVSQAKMILLRMQHRILKIELHHACQTIPRGHLQELLRSARRSRLDPSYPMFKTAQLLCEKPESELTILRARGCLRNLDDGVFTRALASVQRFDVKRLGNKEKTVLVAALLQHCGMQMSRALMIEGDMPRNVVKNLQQTIDGCMQYFVETEPMQLVRNIILSISREGIAAPTDDSIAVANSHGSGPLMQLKRMHSKLDAAGVGSSDLSSRGTGGQFVLHKFAGIRPVEAQTKTGFLGRRKTTISDATNCLIFSPEPVQTSILMMQKNEADAAVEFFKALLVVMGDKPGQSIGTTRLLSSTTDANILAYELVNLGLKTPSIRDELYIQVCKQLARNPKEPSRVRGLTLLSTYLHCFPPSANFFPYLRNFLTQLKQEQLSESSNRRNTIVDTDGPDCNALVSNLIQYAVKSATWCDNEMILDNGFQTDISMIDAALMKDVISRSSIELELGLMSGSIHKMRICFGDIDSAFSLVRILVEELLGHGYSEATALKSLPDGCSLPFERSPPGSAIRPAIERSTSNTAALAMMTARNDLIMKLIRGFWLYDVDSSCNLYDAQAIPVQPDEAFVVPWHADLLWDLAQNNPGGMPRRLMLRRRLLMCSEDLFDQIEVFRDMAIERDNLGTKRLWSAWLRDDINGLPVDHARVDLLFAEESRYVNSRLYALSEDAYVYLIALQLILSWTAHTAPVTWGSGQEAVMNNVDSSVRPSMKKSSYVLKVVVPRSERKRSSLMSSMDAGDGHRDSIMSIGGIMRGRAGSVVSVSSAEEEEIEGYDDNVSWSGEPVRGVDLTADDISFLEEALTMLGISHSPELIADIADQMYYFHQMAYQMNVSVESQRFKYMVKTAYLTYTMAWPLAGGHFAEALFDKDNKGATEDNLMKVLICISGNGIHLLSAEDWSLVFHAPMYDIQACTVSSAAAYADSSADSQLLRIVVNDLPIALITPSARDMQHLFDAFNAEMLSTGAFPRGTEGGNDILDVGESFTQASEMKAVMHRFVKNFPMFPTPPVPLPLSLSKSYFAPPKSKRAILAEERAEEERIEKEQARLAAETHAAKNMAHLEQGKETLQQFLTDDDDDDEDKVEISSQGGKAKSKRRKRNTLINMRENIDQQLPSMINAAVCGVSNRPPLVKLDIPPPPVRGVGLRIDTMFGDGDVEKPPLLSACFADQEPPPNVPIELYRPNRSTLKVASYPLTVEWVAKRDPSEYDDEVDDAVFDGNMEFAWLRGQQYDEDRDDVSYHMGNYYTSSTKGFNSRPPGDNEKDNMMQERPSASVCLYSEVLDPDAKSEESGHSTDEGGILEEKTNGIPTDSPAD